MISISQTNSRSFFHFCVGETVGYFFIQSGPVIICDFQALWYLKFRPVDNFHIFHVVSLPEICLFRKKETIYAKIWPYIVSHGPICDPARPRQVILVLPVRVETDIKSLIISFLRKIMEVSRTRNWTCVSFPSRIQFFNSSLKYFRKVEIFWNFRPKILVKSTGFESFLCSTA